MKWTVLSDNRTCDKRLETEHGLSILLETSRHKILLDTGAGDTFIRNAERLGIDLGEVDYVFVSHGHGDHAGGLRYIMQVNNRSKVILSPYARDGLFYSKRGNLHSITAQWPTIASDRMVLTDESCTVDEDLSIIVQIPRCHPMPQGNRHLLVKKSDGSFEADDFRHEIALYVEGLLFTGCAHSGLENILAACPCPVSAVLGGFHLLDGYETTDELTALAKRLTTAYPRTQFHTSHCTGDAAFATLKATMGDQLHSFSCGTTH